MFSSPELPVYMKPVYNVYTILSFLLQDALCRRQRIHILLPNGSDLDQE